ncbi:MAG: hypothetical protein MHPSP_002448, partial [Paramarteilia canceri]
PTAQKPKYFVCEQALGFNIEMRQNNIFKLGCKGVSSSLDSIETYRKEEEQLIRGFLAVFEKIAIASILISKVIRQNNSNKEQRKISVFFVQRGKNTFLTSLVSNNDFLSENNEKYFVQY